MKPKGNAMALHGKNRKSEDCRKTTTFFGEKNGGKSSFLKMNMGAPLFLTLKKETNPSGARANEKKGVKMECFPILMSFAIAKASC